MTSLDPDASAVLIWLPRGEAATAADFEITADVKPLPTANQEPWWTLEDAINYAQNPPTDLDKSPWIKVGDNILGPSQIAQVASGLRAMRRFA
jgi:hypothetical protein